MYKTETHLHTKPVSGCAWLEAQEMMQRYREAGYTTVFVSDHFTRGTMERLRSGGTWEQGVDAFLQGYKDACSEGEKLGLHVLLSAELSLAENHFLLYGVDRAFLCMREDIFDMQPADFCTHAHAHGVTVIQAHPLRDGKCTPHPECVDGMEAINSNPRHENFDDAIFAMGKARGLPVTAGSDAHRIEDVAGAAMLSDVPITSAAQYVDLLMQGQLKLLKGECIL